PTIFLAVVRIVVDSSSASGRGNVGQNSICRCGPGRLRNIRQAGSRVDRKNTARNGVGAVTTLETVRFPRCYRLPVESLRKHLRPTDCTTGAGLWAVDRTRQ